jgi:hypothetical protein
MFVRPVGHHLDAGPLLDRPGGGMGMGIFVWIFSLAWLPLVWGRRRGCNRAPPRASESRTPTAAAQAAGSAMRHPRGGAPPPPPQDA